MKLKPTPLEIPADDPFRNDALARKPIVESLSALVTNVDPPFVLCVDSPWGTGKTTFLKLWQKHLALQSVEVLYFNAWTTDFATDPLVAFVGEIANLVQSKIPKKKAKHLKSAKRIASLLAKRTLPVLGKIATAGALDLDEVTEAALADFVHESIKDATDAYTAEKSLIDQFRTEIQKLVEQLPAKDGESRLLLLVDELDRCRPTYALELLERIKHLFDVPNVLFVLALDKRQLRTSVEAVYGSGIDSEDYLRRFIDLEYRLPTPKVDSFSGYLFSQFDFAGFFGKRTHHEFRDEAQNLISTFNGLARVFRLSLRVQEQCFTRIRLALLSTPADHYLHPELLTALVILRTVSIERFMRFTDKEGTVTEVMEFIRQQLGGAPFADDHEGVVLECYLIAVKLKSSETVPELEEYRRLAQDKEETGNSKARADKERAEKVITIVGQMTTRRGRPNLQYILSKIELGFQLS